MKTKLLLIILSSFIIFSKVKSQILPYIQVEFTNIEPIWTHVSIDSTLIDNDKYDGMTQISPVSDRPLPYLIDNNYLYIASNTTIITEYENEGGLIEKLDLKTGKTQWVNHFDRRNSDRYEYIESIYINNSGDLEVVTDRKIVKSDMDNIVLWYSGDTARLSIRNYDLSSGDLIAHQFPDSSDYLSKIIRYDALNRTLLFPLKNNKFLYVDNIKSKIYKQYLLDENGHLLAEPMIDTLAFDKLFNPDSILYPESGKMLRISEDTLIALDFLYNKSDYQKNRLNPDFDRQTKLTLYDKNLEVKKELKIDSLLPNRYDFLKLEFANKKHIGLIGRVKHHYFKRDTFFYTIFNWDGKVENHFLAIYKNDFFDLKMTFLEKENEYIGVGISDYDSSLRFFKTNKDGGLTFIKDLHFKNNGRILYPEFITQLDNGDILLKGSNKLKNGDYKYLFWQEWMRIKAEDLGLKTSVEYVTGKEKKKFSIYPNPPSDKLNIEFPENFQGYIEIVDELGRMIAKHKITNEIIKTLDISKLQSGVYFVRAISDNKIYQVVSFVKE